MKLRVMAAAAATAWLALAPIDTTAQSLPMLTDCAKAPEPTFCQANLRQQQRERQALARNDYQAMRNAAFCQWSGCDGAVDVDKISACAWRRAILRLHGGPSGRADNTDRGNQRVCAEAGF
jgi:hypothetical protein